VKEEGKRKKREKKRLVPTVARSSKNGVTHPIDPLSASSPLTRDVVAEEKKKEEGKGEGNRTSRETRHRPWPLTNHSIRSVPLVQEEGKGKRKGKKE